MRQILAILDEWILDERERNRKDLTDTDEPTDIEKGFYDGKMGELDHLDRLVRDLRYHYETPKDKHCKCGGLLVFYEHVFYCADELLLGDGNYYMTTGSWLCLKCGDTEVYERVYNSIWTLPNAVNYRYWEPAHLNPEMGLDHAQKTLTDIWNSNKQAENKPSIQCKECGSALLEYDDWEGWFYCTLCGYYGQMLHQEAIACPEP